MEYSHQGHISNVVAGIRNRIEGPRTAEKLDKEAVEAIDILHHALVFTHHEQGMDIWRKALWGRHLDPEGEHSIRAMMDYLLAAAARGDFEEASRICDCLDEVMPPKEVFQSEMARASA